MKKGVAVFTLLILIVSAFAFFEIGNQKDVSLSPETEGIVSKTYIYAGSLLASDSSEEGVRYYVQDHLGSNRKVLIEGYVEQGDDFFAFGEAKNHEGDGNNDYKFTGKELDSETGLYYYGARYYLPEIGRFVQADALSGSMGDPASMNRFVYTANNPLKYIDPTGNRMVVNWAVPVSQGDSTVMMGLGEAYNKFEKDHPILSWIYNPYDPNDLVMTNSVGKVGGKAVSKTGSAFIRTVKNFLGEGRQSKVMGTTANTALKLDAVPGEGKMAKAFSEVGGTTPKILAEGTFEVTEGASKSTYKNALEMELMEGESLAKRVGLMDQVDIDVTDKITAGAVDELEGTLKKFVKKTGFEHGDLRPGNMYLTSEGTIGVLDFGRTAVPGQAVFSHAEGIGMLRGMLE